MGPTQAKKIGLGNKLVPEGMAGSSTSAAGKGALIDEDVCPVADPTPPLQSKSKGGKTEEGGDDAAKGSVGSGVRRFVGTSVRGQFELGHPRLAVEFASSSISSQHPTCPARPVA